MTLSLQNISYMLSLPIVWETVGVVDVLANWKHTLLTWFARVMVPLACQGFEHVLTRLAQRRSGFYSTRFIYYNVVVT
jgi:hypothetical protein